MIPPAEPPRSGSETDVRTGFSPLSSAKGQQEMEPMGRMFLAHGAPGRDVPRC